MTTLELFSERFAKTGNIAAEGTRRLLGSPALGRLPTLVREAIQNVIDASDDESGPRILIRIRTLAPEQRSVLDREVFARLPGDTSSHDAIADSLAKPGLRVLELCDFGTYGLSGPTRADAPIDDRIQRNFVNFVRNVGAARDVLHGGGTYGYGKSSLYAMSGCSTIVVDSQTRDSEVPVRRLMACHLGSAYDAQADDGIRHRFTGRHWWGISDGPDSIEPATESLARSLAAQLGLPARSEAQTGTSILVIDPLLEATDSSSEADDIVEAVLWNFWPRMAASTPTSRMLRVELEVEGNPHPVPAPEDFPPLDLFAEALAAHREGSGEPKAIACGRPVKHLGDLRVRDGVRAARVGPALREESAIPERSSHIALMRPVELVVKYLVGEPLPDPRFEWAGVFVCSDENAVEEAFARAEPPAHDDWIPDNLPKGHARTFVQTALRRLKEHAERNDAGGLRPADTAHQGPSLAATAGKLGAFLDPVTAAGPGKRATTSRTSSKPRRPSVTRPKFVRLCLDDSGRALAQFEAELTNDSSDDELVLLATPHLVVDGGSTASKHLPSGFDPSVTRIAVGDKLTASDRQQIKVGQQGGAVEIFVTTVPGAAVGLKLELQPGAQE